jgi:hypothetical protein
MFGCWSRHLLDCRLLLQFCFFLREHLQLWDGLRYRVRVGCDFCLLRLSLCVCLELRKFLLGLLLLLRRNLQLWRLALGLFLVLPLLILLLSPSLAFALLA